MNREFLEGLGLEKEAIDKAMAEHGKALTEYKEKAEKVDALEEQVSDYQEQLKDRDKQLDELNKLDPEAMKEELKKQQQLNKEQAEKHEQEMAKKTFDFSLEKELTNAKARNPKAVKALLDTESIKLDGSQLLGLTEQLEALQESDAYLFDLEKDNQNEEGTLPNFTTGRHSKGKNDNDPFAQKLAKYKQ